jgi:hypothetical protein
MTLGMSWPENPAREAAYRERERETELIQARAKKSKASRNLRNHLLFEMACISGTRCFFIREGVYSEGTFVICCNLPTSVVLVFSSA